MQAQRVLITDAEGFIGSNLTEQLAQLAARMHAFVRYNARNGPRLGATLSTLWRLTQLRWMVRMTLHLGQ